MSINNSKSIASSSGAAVIPKKTVPSFLQKKKDSSNAQSSALAPSQQSSAAAQKEMVSSQAAVGASNKLSKKQPPSAIKDSYYQVDKEFFPNIQKLREKDPKTLDVNIQKCKEVYDFYERKGKNELDVNDLGNALRSMGYLVGTLEVRELCKELQKPLKQGGRISKPGYIDIKDFFVAAHLVSQKLPNERELLQALQTFDKGNTGYINKDALKGILTRIGDTIPEKDFNELFKPIPCDKKGNMGIQYITKTLIDNSKS